MHIHSCKESKGKKTSGQPDSGFMGIFDDQVRHSEEPQVLSGLKLLAMK